MADQRSSLPVSDRADGIPNAAAPSIAIQVGGSDGTNLRTVKTDSNGVVLVSTKTVLTPSAPAVFSVTTTSQVVVASNPARKGLILTNTSNNRISLAFGTTAVAGSGITLYPQAMFIMDEFSYTAIEVRAVGNTGTSTLGIQEFT